MQTFVQVLVLWVWEVYNTITSLFSKKNAAEVPEETLKLIQNDIYKGDRVGRKNV